MRIPRFGDAVGARARALPSRQQFGSRYPGNPAETVVYDFLPDEQLRELSNLADFLRHAGLRQMDLQYQRAPGDFFSRRAGSPRGIRRR